MAGVIPVANMLSDHELSFPEILLPVDNGFSAIQKSVYECALAGCSTIWIVANDDLAPIVRKTIGDWIYDPVYYDRNLTKFHSNVRKEVPIYYVPIHPKDRDKRDSYGWSVLYGELMAWKTAYGISEWLTPDKYYISFPMSFFDFSKIRENRKLIRDKQKNFYFIFNNKCIKDGLPLSFTMFGEDFKKCRRHINKKTTKEYLPPSQGNYPSEKLPLHLRWTAKRFHLKEIFQPMKLSGSHKEEVDWFFDCREWSEYMNYCSSDNLIANPGEQYTTARKHNKVIKNY
tara:strand:- start:860 stop:1717 length:858 start_codon:yes stop_codon:yes gene_type:complete